MPKEEEVFFSIVIPLLKTPHLIRHTLSSIFAQIFSSYEIIVVAKRSDHHLVDILGESRSQIILTRGKSDDKSELLNRGVKKAKGKYVHFLFPGDTYFSPNSLLEIQQLLDRKNIDLFYFAYIKRDEDVSYAVYHPFSMHWLVKGQLFTKVQSCMFANKSLVRYGGFSLNSQLVPGLDLVLKIFSDPEAKTLFVKKVFCDYEIKKFTPREIFKDAFDTFLVVRKYFGLFKAIKWFIYQDQMRLNTWLKRSLKKAFLKT